MTNESLLLYERPENVSGFADFFFRYPNRIVDSFYGIGLVAAFYAIMFLSLNQVASSRNSLAATSYAGFLFTGIFAALGVVPSQIIILSVVLVVIGTYVAGKEEGGRNI